MSKIGRIFISHAHADKKLADALTEAIGALFGDLIATKHSSNENPEDGIRPGEQWFSWIVDQVLKADVAVILLTPSSILKPWVLWETGAVYGASLASPSEESALNTRRRVRPIVFKLSSREVPSPYAHIQGVAGDQRAGIDLFLRDLISDFQPKMGARAVKAGEILRDTIDTYLDRVKTALRDAPLLPTEAVVQEWCDRLDKFEEEDRLSEIEHVHNWLNVTFGRDRENAPLPLDLRLHRRLGSAYRASKRPDKAVEELSLALEIAPRDIFLLRELGIAHLDGSQLDKAAAVIDRIADLDPTAFSHNVECAALKGRLQRERSDFDGAADTYRLVLERNPKSYYSLDLLGQTYLRLGERDKANGAYRRAARAIEELPEQNLWTLATRATAELVLGNEPEALASLEKIRMLEPKPARDDLQRIEEGLRRVHEDLQLEAGVLEQWLKNLRDPT